MKIRLLNLVNETFTFAAVVLPSANIAKLVLATASHVVAPFILLHPKFAVRTLFVFGTFDKKHELFVLLAEIGHLFIFCTSKALMEFTLAT